MIKVVAASDPSMVAYVRNFDELISQLPKDKQFYIEMNVEDSCYILHNHYPYNTKKCIRVRKVSE